MESPLPTENRSPQRLLLVSTPQRPHVGYSFLQAARRMGFQVECLDPRLAFAGPSFLRRVAWWLGQRRPLRLNRFSYEVKRRALGDRPDIVLTTGCAPVTKQTLHALRTAGMRVVNYSTDDPWNRAVSGPWFRKTLPEYHEIFTTRRSNVADFQRTGCRSVSYLPFGYDPEIHYIQHPAPDDASFASDVVFVGGADGERLSLVRALIDAGWSVHLWGGYWQRRREFKCSARGHTRDSATLRKATVGARLVLCLVRRANRDGHAMRSYEAPAMGGCLLTEDTIEHRQLFGDCGECVSYFADTEGLLVQAEFLLKQPEQRKRMAQRAHGAIVGQKNTYADRLTQILDAVFGEGR